MGKTRPTVGSMIQLLMEANLQRAADYLAVDVLKGRTLELMILIENVKKSFHFSITGDPLERPQEGPAAPVDVSRMLDELIAAQPDHEMVPEKPEFWNSSTAEMDFHGINYPSLISSALGQQPNVGVIEVNFSEGKMQYVDACPAANPQVSSDLIKFSKSFDQVQAQKSDLIKFSTDVIEDGQLKTNENVSEQSGLLPSFSQLGIKPFGEAGDSSASNSITQTTTSVDFTDTSITRTDSMQSSDFNLPAMSQILPDDLKPDNDMKSDEQVDHSVTSGNVQDLPVPVLEFFNK